LISWIRIVRRKVAAGSIGVWSSQSVASINDNAARALGASRRGGRSPRSRGDIMASPASARVVFGVVASCWSCARVTAAASLDGGLASVGLFMSVLLNRCIVSVKVIRVDSYW
jgi:hypothetical protein